MFPLLILSLSAILTTVVASPCVVFDSNFNLLVFDLGGKDYNAGTQDAWSGKTAASDITASGRPPFDGTNTTCYLSEYTNSIYVMNGRQASPTDVDIYDVTAKSWSTQTVTPGSFSPASFDAILDHDTNVFYALSNGELFFLNMNQQTAAQSTPLSWTDVEKAPLPDGYQPVMALAQNHIYFLDVPGVAAGSANIFVIHYSYFQPAAQSYPGSGGNSFPAAQGQTASIFLQNNTAQLEFAFIPDDGSATYVVNVVTNSTQAFAGPSTKDAKSTYAAAVDSIVQLTSDGAVSYLPYQSGSSAAWSPVGPILAAFTPGSTSSGAPSSKTASGASGGASPTAPSSSKSASIPSQPLVGLIPAVTVILTGFTLLQILVIV
jgi:hypothetical protein